MVVSDFQSTILPRRITEEEDFGLDMDFGGTLLIKAAALPVLFLQFKMN